MYVIKTAKDNITSSHNHHKSNDHEYYRDIKFTAPLAVRGGKNSREKNLSPEAFRR